MNLNKSMLAAAITTAVAVAPAAHAVTIDGITFGAGAIFETIDLFEGEKFGDGSGNDNGVIDAPGEVLTGIGRVNAIRDAATNALLWQNGDNNRELTIVIDNYVAEAVTTSTGTVGPNNIAISTILFTGGLVSLYSDAAQDFDPSAGGGTQAATTATASNGNLWLQLAGSPLGGFGPSGAPFTLSSNAQTSTAAPGVPPDPLTTPGTNITGQGFLDVIGGSAAANFDTDFFLCGAAAGAPCPDDADKSFTSSGQIPTTGVPNAGNGWGFVGTGEVQDFAVPEPGTVGLLGAGLAGVAVAARRRRKQS